ncbi:hypothetical protein K466DRAFT_570961, partial [Polyporus arcularius HHB13444]
IRRYGGSRLVSQDPGFNARGVARREWQNGSTWHLRYWFRTPMFLTCEARGGRPDPPEGLHEWVAAAHRKSKTYRANPVRPTVCGLQDGRLELIGNCVPPKLEYGDVVSLVFGITYVEDREDWGPVPMLSHVIRVQHANRDAYQLTYSLAAAEVDDEAGELPIGTIVDEQAARAAVRAGKRPALGDTVDEAFTPGLDDDDGFEDTAEGLPVGGASPTVEGGDLGDGSDDELLSEGSADERLIDDIAEESGGEVELEEQDPQEVLQFNAADDSTSDMDVDEDASMSSYVVLDSAMDGADDAEDAASNGSTLTDGSGAESVGRNPQKGAAEGPRSRSSEQLGDEEVRPAARSPRRANRVPRKGRRGAKN